MAAVNVTNVAILNNPTNFNQPLQFEIQYECVSNLADDLEWRLTYVGSADSQDFDQVLDSVLVGPVGPGQYKFVLQTDAPDPSRLPRGDIVGVTVILLTCLYQDKEFLRIGYYVNNDYQDEESRENPPDPPQIERLLRSILADKPRVTRFPIEWDPVEQIATVGGMSSEMQLDEEGPSTAGFSFDKQQQNGQANQSGFHSNGFSAAIPITAQAGVIDGMEE